MQLKKVKIKILWQQESKKFKNFVKSVKQLFIIIEDETGY